jgi:hypothetical protein
MPTVRVQPDGSLPTFRCKGPTLEVKTIGRREFIRTSNIVEWTGAFGKMTLVRPLGDRWKIHNADSDKVTIWWRSIRNRPIEAK